MRDCSCGDDQLLAISTATTGRTVRNATDIGVGASATVPALALLASLPLVQCSRQSVLPCGADFGAIAAQWLEVAVATAARE